MIANGSIFLERFYEI